MEYDKTLTETLKCLILSTYKNIKQFSDSSGIPYMTISNVLNRGVENSAFGTIEKICSAINISLNDFIVTRKEDTIARKLRELGENYSYEEFSRDLKESKIILGYFIDPTEQKKYMDTYKSYLLRKYPLSVINSKN